MTRDGSTDTGDRIGGLSATKRALLQRWLAERATGRPANEVELRLLEIWRDVLRAPDIGVDDDFFAVGGDSIASLRIAARATALGLRVTSRHVMRAGTVAALARVCATTGGTGPAAVPAEPAGEVPLTPIQRWFFEQGVAGSSHWNQVLSVELRRPVDAVVLERALARVVGEHHVLGSRFTRDADGTWRQVVPDRPPRPVLRTEQLGGLDAAAQDAAISAVLDGAERGINLETGHLVAAVLCRLEPAQPDRLLLVVHHLVVDGVSVRILMDDLERALRDDPAQGRPRSLPFRSWALLLHEYAGDAEVRSRLDHWLAVPDAAACAVPTDMPGTSNTVGGSATLTVEAPPAVAAALLGHRGRSRSRPHHLLLTALALAWRQVTGRTALQVDVEGHGREQIRPDVDVSHTVGWFTSIYPVVLDVGSAGPAAALARIVDTVDRVPDGGLSYGVLRYLTGTDGAALAACPSSQISFNYLGRFETPAGDEPFIGAPVETLGLLRAPDTPRPYLLDVVATAVQRRLLLTWTYSTCHHRAETIDALARHYLEALAALVFARPDRDLAVIRDQLGLGALGR